MSPKNVPSSTISTSAPPWSSPRSSAAWATPSPIQTIISIVTEIEAVIRSRCGIATPSKNISGSVADERQQHLPLVARRAGDDEPDDADHRRQPHRPRALEHHRELVHADRRASAPIPAANTHPPCQMITAANAIAGIATRIRGIRSDVPFLRGPAAARPAAPRAVPI